MTPGPARSVALRNRRKQDLLLASALARQQAVLAIDQIGRRADVLVFGYRQVRYWLSTPQPGTIAGVAASLVGIVALRRVRLARVLRWSLLSWRIAKLVGRLLPAQPRVS